MLASPDVLARARKIKLFLMDVDGTITDGGICLLSATAAATSVVADVYEMKIFNAQDGQGLSLAHTMGIQTGFITGRRSPAVAKRAEELKVTFVYLGQATKMQAFDECIGKAGVTEEEVAYMGDGMSKETAIHFSRARTDLEATKAFYEYLKTNKLKLLHRRTVVVEGDYLFEIALTDKRNIWVKYKVNMNII